MTGRLPTLHVDQHGVSLLLRCEVAPTILCGSISLLLFEESWCITIQAATCLQV